MKYDVFISYSRRDSRQAEKVCKALSDAGLTYFIDREGISAGASFTKVLAKAIDASDVFLFLAGTNAYKSKFTVAEVFYAFKHKRHGAIIPYLLDDCEMPGELEFLLGTVNWLTMKENPVEEALIPAVLTALGRDVPGPVQEEKEKPRRRHFMHASISAAALLLVGVTTVMLGGKPGGFMYPEADVASYEALVARSDSLVREVKLMQEDPDRIRTTRKQISCLQQAGRLIESADSLQSRYADGRYKDSFSLNLGSRAVVIRSRLDSMFRLWSGYARESYGLYELTNAEAEADNVMECISIALSIKDSREMERLRDRLSELPAYAQITFDSRFEDAEKYYRSRQYDMAIRMLELAKKVPGTADAQTRKADSLILLSRAKQISGKKR